jgi:hypothetical protein
MSALWQGIRSGSVSAAMPAFFPEGAYAQVKAIADPRADYNNRLVHEFSQDIAAAHGLLGAGASSAQLVGVQVPSSYAHWVSPGACDNGVGYYEVPNARVVYRDGGQTSSFGIASMISWRGVWYVVHLGAVEPTSDTGTQRSVGALLYLLRSSNSTVSHGAAMSAALISSCARNGFASRRASQRTVTRSSSNGQGSSHSRRS